MLISVNVKSIAGDHKLVEVIMKWNKITSYQVLAILIDKEIITIIRSIRFLVNNNTARNILSFESVPDRIT